MIAVAAGMPAIGKPTLAGLHIFSNVEDIPVASKTQKLCTIVECVCFKQKTNPYRLGLWGIGGRQTPIRFRLCQSNSNAAGGNGRGARPPQVEPSSECASSHRRPVTVRR